MGDCAGGDTLQVLLFHKTMNRLTAKQLHLETKAVLNQLERGESFVITRNGRIIARVEPIDPKDANDWQEVMGKVWEAQAAIKSRKRSLNPVLQERQRRRR